MYFLSIFGAIQLLKCLLNLFSMGDFMNLNSVTVIKIDSKLDNVERIIRCTKGISLDSNFTPIVFVDNEYNFEAEFTVSKLKEKYGNQFEYSDNSNYLNCIQKMIE